MGAMIPMDHRSESFICLQKCIDFVVAIASFPTSTCTRSKVMILTIFETVRNFMSFVSVLTRWSSPNPSPNLRPASAGFFFVCHIKKPPHIHVAAIELFRYRTKFTTTPKSHSTTAAIPAGEAKADSRALGH